MSHSTAASFVEHMASTETGVFWYVRVFCTEIKFLRGGQDALEYFLCGSEEKGVQIIRI